MSDKITRRDALKLGTSVAVSAVASHCALRRRLAVNPYTAEHSGTAMMIAKDGKVCMIPCPVCRN